jgi:creatinine amidohydrolase/Fe(II)-dependent formamide hydrolase-like protein
VRETVTLLADRGFRAVVVLTGHGQLDLVHLLKRVCLDVRAEYRALEVRRRCGRALRTA